MLVNGGPFFDCLVDVIERAKTYVYLESYIVVADETGWRVARALVDKAQQGLEVAVCFDGFGSIGLERGLTDALRRAGVKILEFRPVTPWFGRWPWTKRNHRKLLVADGRIAIVGGMNISNDYAAEADGGRGWRDTSVRIEGPAVTQLDSMFREMWSDYSQDVLRALPGMPGRFDSGHLARFIGNYGFRGRAEIRTAYLHAILKAENTVRITAAYFSPDRGLLKALLGAAERGVEVELITAGATDVELVRLAARGLYSRLIRGGVRVYEWNDRILHAKTAVVDGRWSTIGSANLNHRTWLVDLECNVSILGSAIGAEMDARFEADRARSEHIALAKWRSRPWHQRVLEWFAGLFRRLI